MWLLVAVLAEMCNISIITENLLDNAEGLSVLTVMHGTKSKLHTVQHGKSDYS